MACERRPTDIGYIEKADPGLCLVGGGGNEKEKKKWLKLSLKAQRQKLLFRLRDFHSRTENFFPEANQNFLRSQKRP